MRAMFFIFIALASANFKVVRYYTGSSNCDEAKIGRILAETGVDCAVFQEPCASSYGTRYDTSQRTECMDTMPVMGMNTTVEMQYPKNVVCDGQPRFYDIKRLRYCTTFEYYARKGNSVTKTRYSAPDCTGEAAFYDTYESAPVCRVLSTGGSMQVVFQGN